MTRTPTPNPDKVNTQTTDAQTGDNTEAAPAADPWADLAPPIPMPAKQVAASAPVDVIATVPEVIRKAIEHSLTASCKAVAKAATSQAKRPRIDYDWQLQPVKSTEQGEQFAKLAIKYGKNRPVNTTIPHRGEGTPDGQITVRCGTPGYFRNVGGEWTAVAGDHKDGDILGIRFSARPFENRKDTKRIGVTA